MIYVWADIFAMSVATSFGAVHWIAWSSAFPTGTEKLLWRMSPLVVVGCPLAGWPVFVVMVCIPLESAIALKDLVVNSVGAPLISLYLLARLLLIALSFTTLRSLPFAAYQTIQTTFVPHV